MTRAGLSEDERLLVGKALFGTAMEPSAGNPLLPAIEAIVAARTADLAAQVARAWDEGYDEGIADDLIRVYPDMGKRTNPYREVAR